jgi:spermidine synthase
MYSYGHLSYFDFGSALVAKVNSVCQFPDASEESRIVSGLRWIGLFSDEKVTPRAGNLLDTLCAQLEKLMAYEEGERDLVMLQHKFVVEWKDGKKVCGCLNTLGI